MAQVKEGDTIRVHYTGKFEDGKVFDSSEDGTPIQFTVGQGDLIKGFEKAVLGMSAGESKTVNIPAEEGYGIHKDEMVFEFDKSRASQDFDPQIGQQVQMYRADGMPITVTVTGKSDKSYTMDCNHPLAGKNLIFDIKVVEIVE